MGECYPSSCISYDSGLRVKLPELPEHSSARTFSGNSLIQSLSRARTMGKEIPGILAMPSSFHSLFQLADNDKGKLQFGFKNLITIR